jgi:WD40 repeat protein
VLTLRPGPEPLRALAAAFNPRTETEGAAAYADKIGTEADKLRTGDPNLLSHMIREELDDAEGMPERLLLYIDQWEELYAQALSPGRPAQHAADVNRFIDLLLNATRSAPVTVVGTVRADFYDPLISHPDIRSLLPNQQVLLGGMTRTELESTISGPARLVNLTLDPPTLIQRILDDAGADEGMLPLLQYALKETWNKREGGRLTGDSYTLSGGVREAIRTTAESTFNALSPVDQKAAQQLFLRLVTPGEGQEDTRARAAMPTEIGQVKIVEQFASPRKRLLVTGFDRAKRPTVEVAHEALIRTWPRLHMWVDANRERLRSRSAILHAQADWEQNGRPDDLLLSPGFALARAKELVGDPGDIAVEDFREFVTLSLEHDKKRADWEKAIEVRRQVTSWRRRATWTMGSTAVGGLIFVGLYGYYSFLQQARLSAEAATRELQVTFQVKGQLEERELDLNREFRARVIVSSADAALSQRRISGAADGLVLALAKPSNLPDVGEYVSFLYRGLGELRERRRIEGLQSEVFGASFNPKQRLLSAVTVGSPSLIHFWQDDGVFLDSVTVTESGFIMNARWSPDGQRMYVGTSPTAHVITPCSHEALRKYFDVCRSTSNDVSLAIGTIDNPAGNSGAWSRDGKWILTAGFQSPARLWDALTGDLVPSFVAAINDYKDYRDPPAASVAISADMKRMAVGLVSGEILIVNAEAMTIEKTLKLPLSRRGGVPFSLAFDPKNSNLLLAAYQDPTAQLWNIDAETARPLVQEAGNVIQVAFDPNGKFMVTAANDGVIRLWMMPEVGAELTEFDLQGHLGTVMAVDVNNEGLIVSSGADKTVRLWGKEAPLSARQASDEFGQLERHDFAVDGQEVILARGTGLEFRVQVSDGFDPVDATMSFDGRGVVVAPRHGRPLLFLRDYPDFPAATLSGPNAEWMSVSFVAKQTQIAGKTSDGRVFVWPYISDVPALERLAQENLPFNGSQRITLPARVRCRVLGESSTSCDSLPEWTRQTGKANAAPTAWTGTSGEPADQSSACTSDVFRLCSSEIPNIDRIVACLQRSKSQLSAACAAVYSR